MKPIFAELGILSEQFNSDSSTLSDLLKEEKESEEIVAELNALQKDAESLKTVPSQIKVDSFVTRIKKLNKRLKVFDIDAETKTKIRENLCLLGRGTAIELHNNKHQTAYALTIAKALVEEFNDLSSLRTKLNEDVTTLNQQLLFSGISRTTTTYSPNRTTYPTNNNSSSSKRKGWIIGLLVIIGIIVLIASSSRNGSSNKSTTSSYNRSNNASTAKVTAKPTTKPITTTEKLYSTSSAVGDYVYVTIVLIEPEYGVYTSEVGKTVKSYTRYDDYVCKCTTDTG